MSDAWRDAANQRIEKHRKGDLELRLVDSRGLPRAGVPVSLSHVRHDFRFGTCISTRFDSDEPEERAYRDFIARRFNTVVAENSMKWYSVEREPDALHLRPVTDLLRFCAANNLGLRGHCLLWAKDEFNRPWVREMSPDDLRARIDQHLRTLVPVCRGKLLCWDVINEMLDGDFLSRTLGPAIHAEVFRCVHQADPDTPLFLNEYGVLGSDAAAVEKSHRYLALAKSLVAEGAKVSGLGIQEHSTERMASGQPTSGDSRPPLTPEGVLSRLDDLAELGVPIHLTEISSVHPDPDARAEALESMLRLGFSHPAVEAIVLWGFWSKRHWLGRNAALYDDELAPLAPGAMLERLLTQEWSTQFSSVTNEQGIVRFRGFFGSYEAKLPREAGASTHRVVFTPANASATRTI